MQNIDEARFNELRLRQRRGDADQRLVSKTDAAFRDRMHIAGETIATKVIEQIFAEPPRAFEPIDFGGRKLQRLEIVKCVVQAGGKQEAAPRRQTPYKELKDGLAVVATVQIGLDHIEFVEIGKQGTDRGH